MTRYTITGGAGFLGINLTRYLLARGDEVTTLDLAPFEYADVHDQITSIEGDIRDRAAVDRAVAGADVVIHTAAALPLYTVNDIYTTDITGTKNVLESALHHGIERVVHISSTAVYGIPDHHPLYEDDRLIGVGPYGRAKIKAEELCQQAREAGLCVPVLRPKSFVGPERLGVFALLYDWAHTGHNFPNIGSGNNRYQLLDVADLCDAIHLVATLDRAIVNDTFNIGAAEFTTWKQDVQAVLDEAGHGKQVIPLPIVTPMIWTLRVLEAMNLSPLYKWVYETVSKDSFVSIEKAQRVLGFDPKYSNQQALIRNYHWYVDHLDQFEGTSGVSHRVPWKQGILGAAKIVF